MVKEIKEKIKEEEEKDMTPILIEDLGMIFATENSKNKRRYGIYKCGFCGTEFRASTQDILRGMTRSCGCYQKRRMSELIKTHGLGYTRLYTIWTNMRARVFNNKHKKYSDYGGRGITICDDWKDDVKSFYDWAMSNGYSDKLSIDRIDNDGNYCPENCRWTTRVIQNRNQRIRRDNTSGYKGVNLHKRDKIFMARILVNNKRIDLGRFKTAEEGAVAYNNFIIENNLEGFVLNKIPQEYLEKEITNEKIN